MPGNDVNEDIAEFLNCDQCESQFEGKGNLENHIQSRHEIPESIKNGVSVVYKIYCFVLSVFSLILSIK